VGSSCEVYIIRFVVKNARPVRGCVTFEIGLCAQSLNFIILGSIDNTTGMAYVITQREKQSDFITLAPQLEFYNLKRNACDT
jgi:hypothetical protein